MWTLFLGIGLALIATYAIRPKPQNVKPASLQDVEVPKAEDGAEIPVLFGTRDIKSANVVWYGDLDTKAIRAKAGKK